MCQLDDLGARICGLAINRGLRASLDCGVALGRIDIDHDDAGASHRLSQRETHEAKPPGADDDQRFALQARAEFLQRARGGDT